MGLSVLMSVYEKENPEYFKMAMDSIIQQSRMPDEIVLIQDGPVTEKLNTLINHYESTILCLRVYRMKKNVGLGQALAKGVQLSSNELIARMDTDDIAVFDRLEKQYEYMMKHPEISVTAGYMEEFCDDDSDYHKVKTMPIQMSDIVQYAKYRNPMNHMTVMFRRSKVLEAGNYRHFPYLEDYDLWCRMIAKGNLFYNFPEVLVKARTNKNLYGRRGGISYCRQYLKLRKEQRKEKLLNFKEYHIARILTMGITLLPSSIRKFVYQKILRK